MKKLALLLIFAILMIPFSTAAGPPLRLVRLVVINKSGNVVYIKLTGSKVGRHFYYLTVAKGSKTQPTVGWFTVVSDIYARQTTYGAGDNAACEGVASRGQLIMDSNIRLTLTQCDTIPWKVNAYHWAYLNGGAFKVVDSAKVNRGEPRMEKVTYFRLVRFRNQFPDLENLDRFKHPYDFNPDVTKEKFGCGFYSWRVSPFRNPLALCYWRYRY